ncbi:MAG: ISC system 2Fe-2S type ferredoxin [Oricola sp.]
MSLITIKPSGKTVEALEGASLLSVIRSVDGGFAGKCADDACTGSCHVYVQEGRKGLSRTSREENEKLDTIVGVGSKSRLACFVTVLGTEDVTVEELGFDSGF